MSDNSKRVKATNPRMDEGTQSERFKEAARELGCDEDEAAFDEKLRRIGKAKPKSDERKPRKPGKDRG